METDLKLTYEILSWEKIFMLMSMERVEPFFPEMELVLSPNVLAKIRPIARQFFDEFVVGADTRQYQAILERTLEQIEANTNPQTSDLLKHWIQVNTPTDLEQARSIGIWEILLRRFAELSHQNEAEMQAPELDPEKTKMIKHLVQEVLGTYYRGVAERVEELDRLERTEWEEHVYRKYRNLIPKEVSDVVSPLDTLLESINSHLFRQVWVSVRNLLTPAELGILLDWARVQARNMALFSTLELPEI